MAMVHQERDAVRFLADRVLRCARDDRQILRRELEAHRRTRVAFHDPRQDDRAFEWQLGDLIVWDNRRLLHRACSYDEQSETRELLNCRIAGDAQRDAGLDTADAQRSEEVQRAEVVQEQLLVLRLLDQVINELMGKDPAPRYEFIMEHAPRAEADVLDL